MDGTGTSSAPLVVHCGGGGGPCQFLAVEQVDARDISVTEPCGPVPAHGEERTCGRWCCVSVVDGAGWGWVCRITLGAGMGKRAEPIRTLRGMRILSRRGGASGVTHSYVAIQ